MANLSTIISNCYSSTSGSPINNVTFQNALNNNNTIEITAPIWISGAFTIDNPNLVLSGGGTINRYPSGNCYPKQMSSMTDITLNMDVTFPFDSTCHASWTNVTMGAVNFGTDSGTFVSNTPWTPLNTGMVFTNCSLGQIFGAFDECEFYNTDFRATMQYSGSYNIFEDCNFNTGNNNIATTAMSFGAINGYRTSRRRNRFTRCVFHHEGEEGWGCDSMGQSNGGTGNNTTQLQVTSVGTNTIGYTVLNQYRPDGTTIADTVGQSISLVTGTAKGKYFEITGATSNTLTIDTSRFDTSGISVGDKIIHGQYMQDCILEDSRMIMNQYRANTLGFSYMTGISLYAGCVGNIVRNNTVELLPDDSQQVVDIRLVAIKSHSWNGSFSYGYIGYHPNSYNVIENNVIDDRFHESVVITSTHYLFSEAEENAQDEADLYSQSPYVDALTNPPSTVGFISGAGIPTYETISNNTYPTTYSSFTPTSGVFRDILMPQAGIGYAENILWGSGNSSTPTIKCFNPWNGVAGENAPSVVDTSRTQSNTYTLFDDPTRYDLAINILTPLITAEGTVNISSLLTGSANRILKAEGIIPIISDSSGDVTKAVNILSAEGTISANVDVSATVTAILKAAGTINAVSNSVGNVTAPEPKTAYDLAVNVIRNEVSTLKIMMFKVSDGVYYGKKVG